MARRALERVFVRQEYSEFFPRAEFDGYGAFVAARGKVLKSERRTRVVILRRQAGAEPLRQERRFVCKEYRYPWLPRIRTWLRISKAEHEFNSLGQVAALGLACAEPVACGAQRTALGFVRSCFVVTGFVEDSVTLKDSPGTERFRSLPEERAYICRRLARILRRLHQARLFLFTAKPKNILLRRDRGREQIVLIDLPYARFLRWPPLARWAQARDLAMVFANYMPRMSDEETAPFYEAYFPDPLGAHERAVRRRVARAVRVRQNQTFLSWLGHRSRQALKLAKGWHTSADRDTRDSEVRL
jgi:hypothetical protein